MKRFGRTRDILGINRLNTVDDQHVRLHFFDLALNQVEICLGINIKFVGFHPEPFCAQFYLGGGFFCGNIEDFLPPEQTDLPV